MDENDSVRLPGFGMYILGPNRLPIPCDNPIAWATWMGDSDRTVVRDVIEGYLISTVFLGLDHNHFMQGDPILYETMIFPPENDRGEDSYMERYRTEAEAKAGHERVRQMLQHELKEAAGASKNILAKFKEAKVN